MGFWNSCEVKDSLFLGLWVKFHTLTRRAFCALTVAVEAQALNSFHRVDLSRAAEPEVSHLHSFSLISFLYSRLLATLCGRVQERPADSLAIYPLSCNWQSYQLGCPTVNLCICLKGLVRCFLAWSELDSLSLESTLSLC